MDLWQLSMSLLTIVPTWKEGYKRYLWSLDGYDDEFLSSCFTWYVYGEFPGWFCLAVSLTLNV